MSAPAAAFPWRDVMAFGLGRLRWPPEQFWAATPREIAAVLQAYQHITSTGTEPPPRSVLTRLMAAYPDR